MGRKNILVNGMHLIRSKNIEITTFLEGKNDNEQKDKVIQSWTLKQIKLIQIGKEVFSSSKMKMEYWIW